MCVCVCVSCVVCVVRRRRHRHRRCCLCAAAADAVAAVGAVSDVCCRYYPKGLQASSLFTDFVIEWSVLYVAFRSCPRFALRARSSVCVLSLIHI